MTDIRFRQHPIRHSQGRASTIFTLLLIAALAILARAHVVTAGRGIA